MDCLFLHVPKKVGNYLEILKMPLGLTALAYLLQKNGISSKIFHLTIEEKLNDKFKIEEYIKASKIKYVCLSLHWHPQSYMVIETAKKIKSVNPDCKIILGGFTATLFAKEILSAFKESDFIIKGDAEIPLLELLKSLINNKIKDFEDVPNLAWRKEEKVVENDLSFIIDQKLLDELEFYHLDLINHCEIYSRIYDYEKNLEKTSTEIIKRGRTFAYYNAGRGCPVNCSFCGGSNLSQCILNNRERFIFKSFSSVLIDLIGFKKFGIENVYTSFDPDPKGNYYIKLFEEIKKREISYNLYFECWDLPTKEFMDAFSGTFGKDSYIIISPDAGSEKIRKLNKGYFYTNSELFAALDYLYQKKIKGQLYFSLGFPFEEKADIDETEKLMILIKKKYHKFFKISFMPIELDPGSPMWLDSKKYKVTIERKNFKDLYLAHQKIPTLGYSTNIFSGDEIIRIYKDISKKV